MISCIPVSAKSAPGKSSWRPKRPPRYWFRLMGSYGSYGSGMMARLLQFTAPHRVERSSRRFSSFDISELCCRQIRWNLWMTWVEWWWFQSCRADWSGLAHAAFGPKVGDSKWTSSEIGWKLKSKSLKIRSQRFTSPNWNISRCWENIFLRRRNWWSSSWL